MIRILVLLPLLLLLTGCGEGQQRPYVVGQKPKTVHSPYPTAKKTDNSVKIATIEAQNRKEIAEIEMDRDLQVQKIQQETKIHEVATGKEIAFNIQKTLGLKDENFYALNTNILIVTSLLVLIVLGLIVYFFLKWREDKLKMHQDEIEKEKELKEKELQVLLATKILDTIASGNLDKEEEHKLIETFEKTNLGLPYKK